jgi:hypothetical protein
MMLLIDQSERGTLGSVRSPQTSIPGGASPPRVSDTV